MRSGSTPTRSRTNAVMNSGGKRRSWRPATTRHVVVVEGVVVGGVGVAALLDGEAAHRRPLPGRLPPLTAALPGAGHHGGHEHQEVGMAPLGRHRCGQAAERLSDDDETGPTGRQGRPRRHGLHHGAHVVLQARRLVARRKVDGHGDVPAKGQPRHDSVPVPGRPPGARDEDERAHLPTSAEHDRTATAPDGGDGPVRSARFTPARWAMPTEPVAEAPPGGSTMGS